MNKKNDKKLCWNCDGDISLHLSQCPYCGVDATQPVTDVLNEASAYKGFTSPFQSSNQIPKPPYANLFSNDFSVSEEEWNKALDEEKEIAKKVEDESVPSTTKREMIALLLLLPGIVFCLFGLILLMFSQDGILTMKWKQNLAYFYFLGAIPLLYLGWRSFK